MVLDKPYRRIMSENAGGPPLGDAMVERGVLREDAGRGI